MLGGDCLEGDKTGLDWLYLRLVPSEPNVECILSLGRVRHNQNPSLLWISTRYW